MISIRNGVFETNSSSSHSVCMRTGKPHIDSDAIANDIKLRLDSDNKWNLSNERRDYGRAPFTILSTFTEKVLYYIANECDYGTTKHDYVDKMHPITKIIKEFYPEFAGFTLNEQETKDRDKDDNYWIGSVDEYINLAPTDEALRNFLTNDDVFVVVDGDEYNIFSDMRYFGMINGKELD